jgi:hypothetical protein
VFKKDGPAQNFAKWLVDPEGLNLIEGHIKPLFKWLLDPEGLNLIDGHIKPLFEWLLDPKGLNLMTEFKLLFMFDILPMINRIISYELDVLSAYVDSRLWAAMYGILSVLHKDVAYGAAAQAFGPAATSRGRSNTARGRPATYLEIRDELKWKLRKINNEAIKDHASMKAKKDQTRAEWAFESAHDITP